MAKTVRMAATTSTPNSHAVHRHSQATHRSHLRAGSNCSALNYHEHRKAQLYLTIDARRLRSQRSHAGRS